MNELATTFLQTYAAGGEADGGWIYGKALQQARLDYTPDSLKRLDALLTQIRERARPGRAELDSLQGRNFQSLVAFYVIEIARRLSRADIVWHDRASALQALPPGTPLDESPSTRLVAQVPDQAMLLKPLAWLEAQVLPDGERLGAGDYVAHVVAQLERDGPAEWWQAMHAAGKLGSWQMSMAADRRPVWPTQVSQTAPMTLQPIGTDDLREAVAYGDGLLVANPDNATWRVFSYCGFLERDGARLDAVIVLTASYGEKAARMKLAFPFKPARDGQRLVILRPALVEANLTVETVGKLNDALERGIRDVKWSVGGSWDELYRG